MKNFNRKWFTLIEMLIVVVIIGILAAALIPRLSSVKDKANDSSRKASVGSIVTAFSSYMMDNGFPTGVEWGNGSGDSLTLFSGFLKIGGMTNIPTDPSNKGTTIFGVLSTGAVIKGVSKWSWSGFIVAMKAETPGAANWVEGVTTEFSGSTLIDGIQLCEKVTLNTTATAVVNNTKECVATATSQLRIIAKY